MNNLAATAQRLRLVKEANKRFLALWAADCIMDSTDALHTMLNDAQKLHQTVFSPQKRSRFADDYDE